MRRINAVLGLATLALGVVPVAAERGYPRIETVFPGAVSRGKTTEVMLTGRYNLKETCRVVFEGTGISATVGEWTDLSDPSQPKEKHRAFEREGLKIKITVAADTPPGVREFRLLTKGSLSAVAHLLIADVEAVNEVEPNDSIEQAQPIHVPQVVNGKLDKAVDFDVYQFSAKAGDHISFLVHAARLQEAVPNLERSFSDLTLSLRDQHNREIAANDDFHGEDPCLFHVFQQAGTYYLFVSEASYRSGKNKWWYALSILTTPQVTSVFPLAAVAGKKVKLLPRGFNLDGLEQVEVTVPADAQDHWQFQLPSPRGSSNLVTLRITDLPEVPLPPGEKLPVTMHFPGGVNGCLSRDRSTDTYRFHALRGERFEFEVEAHRYGSALDALLELRDSRGKLIAAQDDGIITVGQTADGLAYPAEKDPRLEWISRAEGDYNLTVRDANYFGGKDFVYHLVARRAHPDFALILDDDRMPVGPGQSIGRLVIVERRNGFTGPVQLSVRGLPPGVSAPPAFIPAELDQANLVLTAAPGARMDIRNVQVVGTALLQGEHGQSQRIERVAKPYATMGEAGGKSLFPVHNAAVAIVEGSDIILEPSPREVRLRPGESVTVKIHVTRDHYSGPVELNVILWNLMQRFSRLPKGVLFDEKQSKTSLGENETEGWVTYRAMPDAPPLENYLMVVLGQITYNRIFMTREAAPFRLTVAHPETAVKQVARK